LAEVQVLTPAQREVLQGALPTPPDWVEITSLRDAQDVLRSQKVQMVKYPADQLTRAGAVSRIDGPAHSLRRKMLQRLVRRDGHAWFRETVLYPTVERNLTKILGSNPAGAAVPMDLVAFSDRVNAELAAAIAGFDGLDTEEGFEEFEKLDNVADRLSRLASRGILYNDIDEGIIADGVKATEEIRDRFYKPALARRREMIQSVEAGEMAEDDLPRDLTTLIAMHLDPAHEADPEIGLRDAMVVFRGGSESPSQGLTFAVHYLTQWLAKHPEDQSRCTDPDFVLAVINETLRVGIGSSMTIRHAVEDLTLSSGKEIKAGQYILVRRHAVNRDPIYGPDAGEFNPHRQVPDGVYPYGVAFGSGPHMCFGVPIVLGNEGIDGSLVYQLRRLYELGIRPDPDNPPTRRTYDLHTEVRAQDMTHFGTYPVLLGGTR